GSHAITALSCLDVLDIGTIYIAECEEFGPGRWVLYLDIWHPVGAPVPSRTLRRKISPPPNVSCGSSQSTSPSVQPTAFPALPCAARIDPRSLVQQQLVPDGGCVYHRVSGGRERTGAKPGIGL
ncbi:hypothetical protein E4U14_007182, partial [Claviceps sp. LM454 group G7]